jgi:hypothetical protein
MINIELIKVLNGQWGQKLILKVIKIINLVFPQTTIKINPSPSDYKNQ